MEGGAQHCLAAAVDRKAGCHQLQQRDQRLCAVASSPWLKINRGGSTGIFSPVATCSMLLHHVALKRSSTADQKDQEIKLSFFSSLGESLQV